MMKNNILLKEMKFEYTIGENTSTEISGQPELWLKVWESIKSKEVDFKNLIDGIKKRHDLNVILTGAGTSAFIGDVLEGPFQVSTNLVTKAIATTDLITHPELYFQKDKEILLISFARSGDSPESATAVSLAEQLCKKVTNLVITCNQKSKLVDSIKNNKDFVFFLPPEADDKSLAMTSSFTSMLLAGLLISDIDSIDKNKYEVELLVQYAHKIFDQYLNALKEVAELDFDRAVFLGSGLMKGIARESQLKLQELTDGKVICKYDTFLGFRHGPKAVINEKSLITFLFSNNKYVNKYEVDLVKTISDGRQPAYSIGVMESRIPNVELKLEIVLGNGKNKLSEKFLTIVSVLPAQILGFYKSLQFGLNPDNPSESGMIHRVVQGVNIYPYKKNGKE